jgi:hypothetical protein
MPVGKDSGEDSRTGRLQSRHDRSNVAFGKHVERPAIAEVGITSV